MKCKIPFIFLFWIYSSLAQVGESGMGGHPWPGERTLATPQALATLPLATPSSSPPLSLPTSQSLALPRSMARPPSPPQSLSSSPSTHLSPSTFPPHRTSSSSPLQETLHRLSNALNGNLTLSPTEKVNQPPVILHLHSLSSVIRENTGVRTPLSVFWPL